MTQPLVPLFESDLAVCRALIAEGSKSFSLASRLLPERMRDPAAVFYAFCRVADDLVDEGNDPHAAVVELRERLDMVFAPVTISPSIPHAVDRALRRVVLDYGLTRAPFDALIEGFVWDAKERHYESFDDVLEYCARVASTVGVVMTQLMGERRPSVLARACDLGAAMQLTNICRDVAEDARRGRCYLPAAWLREAGLDPDAWMKAPGPHPALNEVTRRMLDEAETLYARSEAGIPELPRDCRAAIYAARVIYADIGRVIAKRGYDPMVGRAVVSRGRKLWLAAWAWLTVPRRTQPQPLAAAPLSQTAFLCPAEAP